LHAQPAPAPHKRQRNKPTLIRSIRLIRKRLKKESYLLLVAARRTAPSSRGINQIVSDRHLFSRRTATSTAPVGRTDQKFHSSGRTFRAVSNKSARIKEMIFVTINHCTALAHWK
jgi:hypothetical protein